MNKLIADLKNKNFKHIYLLYGEEAYLLNQFKNNLIKALSVEGDTMNTNFFDGKDVTEEAVIDQAETMPFFADHRLIVVSNTGFFKKASDKLAEYVAAIPETSYIVFVEDAVDKRNKLYKAVNKVDGCIEFKRQTEQTIQTWILSRIRSENKQITRGAMEEFMTRTGNDMENINCELEKLLSYTMEKSGIEVNDVLDICSGQIEGKIFEMIEAIANRRKERALDLYYDLLALKEPPMRILYLISRQFNQLLLLRSMLDDGYDYESMSKQLKMQSWLVRKNTGIARSFKTSELQAKVAAATEVETAVKTGLMNDQIAVETFIIANL